MNDFLCWLTYISVSLKGISHSRIAVIYLLKEFSKYMHVSSPPLVSLKF